MRTQITQLLVIFFLASLPITAHAQLASDPPSEKDALEIISTHKRIKASLFKIIRITPGRQIEKDGFMHENVARITAFAPRSAGRPTREIKHYLMNYTEEYGWFIESIKEDARGIYLEISSQKKGRVFIR